MNFAVIFAGGVGSRMHSKGMPKQFLPVFGKPIIVYTLEKFQEAQSVDGIVVVSLESYIDKMRQLADSYHLSKIVSIVPGGASGQDSIYNGLDAMRGKARPDDVVLIHDGVRPVIDSELIEACIESVKKYGTAISASPAIETIVRSSDSSQSDIREIIPRAECLMAKAPQAFRYGRILAAHDRARQEGYHDAIDSASLMKHYGEDLHMVRCKPDNIKITTPVDYFLFKGIVEASENYNVFGL